VIELEAWDWDNGQKCKIYHSQSVVNIKQGGWFEDESSGNEVEGNQLVNNEENETPAPARPQRARQMPSRLADCEVLPDSAVSNEGDDLLVTGSDSNEIEKFKLTMSKEFEMTDLGKLSYFLGIEFVRTSKGMMMHQHKYAREVLDRFEMNECNSVSNPSDTNSKLEECSDEGVVDSTMFKQMIGSLRYLCNSMPDICFAVGVISRLMNSPRKSHLIAAKRVMRYVKGTIKYGLLFSSQGSEAQVELIGYTDSDWCGDRVDKRSTLGYVCMLNGTAICWASKKQPVTALSSCEAEYIASTYAACQLVWLESLMKELECDLKKPLQLLIDNRYVINLAKNPVAHGRSKHIETRFHFIREQVVNGKIEVVHCPTQNQLADGLTKVVKLDRFEVLRDKLGIVSVEVSEALKDQRLCRVRVRRLKCQKL
jgi:hypothetical protein